MNVLEARRRILGADVHKKTAEGNPISVRSLARMYPGIEMQGWTEHQSTTEAQLLDIDSGTIRGWNIENITNTLEAGQTYTFTNIDASVATTLLGRNSSGEDIIFGVGYIGAGKSAIFEMPGEVDSLVLGGGSAGLQKNNHFMLNAGSEALPWEPYTGGQPSPSPDYPQEIVNAGSWNEDSQKWEYDISIKNGLLDDSLWSAENWQAYGENPSAGYKSFLVQAKPNATYTISRKDDKGMGLGIYLCINTDQRTSNAGTFLINSITEVRNKQSVQVSTDDTGIILITSSNYNNLSKVKEVAGYIQIDEGTEALLYREPKVQAVTLTSDRPLTKWDRLEKRNGQWGWVFRSAEIVLNGSETWKLYSSNNGFYSEQKSMAKMYFGEGFSERFRIIKNASEIGYKNAFVLGSNNQIVYAVDLSQFDDAAENKGMQAWKDYLSENPVTILTYADDETFTPLTASEQEQMNALHTNYPTTVLVNDQGCEMKLTYKTKKSLEVT